MLSGPVGAIYTQSNSGFMEHPCFEKIGRFPLRHVDMWRIGPMWPKCAFGDQKGLIKKKRHAIWQSPSSWDKKLRTLKNRFLFFTLHGSKSGILGQKRCFGVFWTECEVADLKQRQRTTAMDHRNKIQSLVLPTDDPGDAPDCITEYGPCTCEYGQMCHTAPTAQKYGVSIELKLDSAFLVRLEPSKSMPATKYGQQRETRGKHPGGP